MQVTFVEAHAGTKQSFPLDLQHFLCNYFLFFGSFIDIKKA